MSITTTFPIWKEGGILGAVEIDRSNGLKVFDRIHDKMAALVDKYALEDMAAVLDSRSYLELMDYLHEEKGIERDIETMYTQFGQLTFVVLPQTKKRIQVISSSSVRNATMLTDWGE